MLDKVNSKVDEVNHCADKVKDRMDQFELFQKQEAAFMQKINERLTTVEKSKKKAGQVVTTTMPG